MPQKIVTTDLSEDFKQVFELLESNGIVLFEKPIDAFEKFKSSFDAYQKEVFEIELKYVSGSFMKDDTLLQFYRNPEKLSNTYTKRYLKTL